MKVYFHKNSKKALEKYTSSQAEHIRMKIKELVNYYAGSGHIPYKELHIKSLEGKWQGYYRMKIGKIRIIFDIDKINLELNILEIDNRGDIYK